MKLLERTFQSSLVTRGVTVSGKDVYDTVSSCLWGTASRMQLERAIRDANLIIQGRNRNRNAVSRGSVYAATDFLRSMKP